MDIFQGQLKKIPELNNSIIKCIKISNDDNYILCYLKNEIIRVWNLLESKEETFFVDNKDYPLAVTMTSDKNNIISWSYDNTLIKWNF